MRDLWTRVWQTLQVFIYSYFEKDCRKKCKRQSRKALWVVLSLLFFKDIWKNWYESPEEMCLRVLKEGNKSRFDGYSRQKQCIDYLPYYLSGLSRAHFSDNLSRNSCIPDWKNVVAKRCKPWTMRFQGLMGIRSLAKQIESSFDKSFHCHEMLVRMQIPRVLCLRHAVVFFCLPRTGF